MRDRANPRFDVDSTASVNLGEQAKFLALLLLLVLFVRGLASSLALALVSQSQSELQMGQPLTAPSSVCRLCLPALSWVLQLWRTICLAARDGPRLDLAGEPTLPQSALRNQPWSP